MSAVEVAVQRAELLNISDASEPRSLSRLAFLATRQVLACSAAAAALWQATELEMLAASHPDVCALIDVQVSSGRGPLFDALADNARRRMVVCPDTLRDERWPEFAAVALRAGIRWAITLARGDGNRAVTLALFGARPLMPDGGQLEAAEQLMAFGDTAMGNVAEYTQVRRTAVQLRASAESRMLVDEAKLVLMRVLGIDPDAALERMKQISQAKNLKVTEVASMIVRFGGSAGSI